MINQFAATSAMSTEHSAVLPEHLETMEKMRAFLASATHNWQQDQQMKRFTLPNSELASCVYWNGIFYITGTDIVRVLAFRFEAVGRKVKNSKKFEEGIFSDLRNLKSGENATLEEPRSEFLEVLYKNNCVRTQKKQKVFYWFSVPHEQLFLVRFSRFCVI